MALKRLLWDGGEEGPRGSSKRRLLEGMNFGWSSKELVSFLEPRIRKWVQEEVENVVYSSLRSSNSQIGCSESRIFQLRFHAKLSHTLFTGSRVVSDNKSSVKIVLYDTRSKEMVSSGPLSSIKVAIVVLDGDFDSDDREDWTTKEFDSKLVKNRQGKRPLVTGELIVPLQDGVGYLSEVNFTDNSSWIRSGKFRLGAKVHSNSDEVNIREAVSNAFKVKDHRGESYQKHYPPSLDDQVWRLEKIAKDGVSYNRLTRSGINSVRDFLRLLVTSQHELRKILNNVSNKTWETIIEHAMTCALDGRKYMYTTTQEIVLFFDSAYRVDGVTSDGKDYHSVNCLSLYQKSVVEDLKQHAYKNLKDWVSISDSSTVEWPMVLSSTTAANATYSNIADSLLEQDQCETKLPTLSPAYDAEVEQDNSSFELRERPCQMQGSNPGFRNSFGLTVYHGGFYISGSIINPQLSTDDLPIDENFHVGSSVEHWNGLFLDSTSTQIGKHRTDIAHGNLGTEKRTEGVNDQNTPVLDSVPVFNTRVFWSFSPSRALFRVLDSVRYISFEENRTNQFVYV